MVLHLDYETRSRCDLLKHGAYNYAQDPSTEIICMGWAIDQTPVKIWKPGDNIPTEIMDIFEAGEPRSVHAHNAQFERLITWYVLCVDMGLPEPPIEAFYCTAAQAAARALPRGLENLGRCLNLSIQKNTRGYELIKLLSVPQEDGEFNYDPDLLEEMYDYCADDVATERLSENCTPPLTDDEFADYIVGEKINDAGLKVDVEFAQAATDYAADERAEICAELERLTDGFITSPQQYAKLKDMMAPYMEANPEIEQAMTLSEFDRKLGKQKKRLAFGKPARRQLLDLEETKPGTLEPHIIEVIELTDEAAKSSVAKFKNMVNRADPETDRVHGAYLFSGAGQTGRYSSVGLQVHNFVRKCAENPLQVREDVLEGYELDNVMTTLSSMLRPSIIADDGKTFVCGDWSAIEARVLPWLSKSEGGEDVLDIFYECDQDPEAPDLYMIEAGHLFNIAPEDVDDFQRSVGKVEVLSMGYQGGFRAFQAMARGYGVKVSDGEAEKIKVAWRKNNPWAPAFWKQLNDASVNATRDPGTTHTAGMVSYCKPGPDTPLYCQLPSDRMLSYPDAKVDLVENKYGSQWELSAIKAQWTPKQGEKEWPRIKLYGGLLAENITQAASADILRHAMRFADRKGFPLVGHTHDELLLEVDENNTSILEASLRDIMLTIPAWAEGLPMAVETWIGKRYRK